MTYWDTQANRWGVFSVPDDDYDEHTAKQAEFIIEQLGVEDIGLLIDVGCGIGRLAGPIADALPDAMVYGVDPSIEMRVELLKVESRIAGCVASLGAVSHRKSVAAGAWCVLVFQHLLEEPIRQILRDVYAVLRPGGRFVTQWMLDVDQAAPAESDVLLLLEEEGFQTLHREDDTDVTGLSFGNWLWVTSEKQ